MAHSWQFENITSPDEFSRVLRHAMVNLELQGLPSDDEREVVGSAFASYCRELSVPTPLGIVLSGVSRHCNKCYANSAFLKVLYCTS